MKPQRKSSLLLKALVWLVLHLAFLGLAFFGFVRWQLGMGLDSLLSGAAGERLRIFGEGIREEMLVRPPAEWDQALGQLATERKVVAGIFDPARLDRFPTPIPDNVLRRAQGALPPSPDPGLGERRRAPPWSRRGALLDGAGPPEGRGPPGGLGPPDGLGPMDGLGPLGGLGRMDGSGPSAAGAVPETPAASEAPQGQAQRLAPPRPAFLLRGSGGDGYWAGVVLQLGATGQPLRHHLLLIRADRLDGSGMFFDFKPWLWGGLAVLALSLAFWTPFMLGITHYLHRLTAATDGIAAGDFQVQLPPRGHDELGRLGHAIQTMAARLGLLISGQKRFLGDAAHELCAPLARLRTGLGILEMKLDDKARQDLAAIDGEAAELAALVEEILAFSRARTRPVKAVPVLLEPLVRETSVRERAVANLRLEIPAGLEVVADSGLLGRALGNVLRNASVHAGPQVTVVISASASSEKVIITVVDDGPGVAPEELPRLFEPFYRPDLSRTRDTGGSGLGLAIVRTAIEACGGTASAFLPPAGGFGIRLELPNPHA